MDRRHIAHAAVSAALGLMRGNLAMLSEASRAHEPLHEAQTLQHRADQLLAEARVAVQHVAG